MLVRSRSARTLRSMAELVSVAVERRARVRLAGSRVKPGAVEVLGEVGGEGAELVQLEPSA